MKNVKSFFNRKSENRTFDAFTTAALNSNMMNLVLGGGDPQDSIVNVLWIDPSKK